MKIAHFTFLKFTAFGCIFRRSSGNHCFPKRNEGFRLRAARSLGCQREKIPRKRTQIGEILRHRTPCRTPGPEHLKNLMDFNEFGKFAEHDQRVLFSFFAVHVCADRLHDASRQHPRATARGAETLCFERVLHRLGDQVPHPARSGGHRERKSCAGLSTSGHARSAMNAARVGTRHARDAQKPQVFKRFPPTSCVPGARNSGATRWKVRNLESSACDFRADRVGDASRPQPQATARGAVRQGFERGLHRLGDQG